MAWICTGRVVFEAVCVSVWPPGRESGRSVQLPLAKLGLSGRVQASPTAFFIDFYVGEALFLPT
jgi:hypothetical protein